MRAAVKQGKKRDPIKKSHYRESIREKVLRQQGTELFSLPRGKAQQSPSEAALHSSAERAPYCISRLRDVQSEQSSGE